MRIHAPRHAPQMAEATTPRTLLITSRGVKQTVLGTEEPGNGGKLQEPTPEWVVCNDAGLGEIARFLDARMLRKVTRRSHYHPTCFANAYCDQSQVGR